MYRKGHAALVSRRTILSRLGTLDNIKLVWWFYNGWCQLYLPYFRTGLTIMKAKASPPQASISKVLSDYCQNTSGHGFQYWVSAGSAVERVLWIAVVLAGFTLALFLVTSSLTHWKDYPTSVDIMDGTQMASRYLLRVECCISIKWIFIFLIFNKINRLHFVMAYYQVVELQKEAWIGQFYSIYYNDHSKYLWSQNDRTFSMPATDLPYPAITVCNKNGHDVGEYLRAVFDNFEYSCKDPNLDCEKSQLLRSHFPEFSSPTDTDASRNIFCLIWIHSPFYL